MAAVWPGQPSHQRSSGTLEIICCGLKIVVRNAGPQLSQYESDFSSETTHAPPVQNHTYSTEIIPLQEHFYGSL